MEFFRRTTRTVFSLLDLVFPSQCIVCNSFLTQARSLCPDCAQGLPRIESPFCQICGEPFSSTSRASRAISSDESISCANCMDLDYSFDFARAALSSSDSATQLISQFKYQKRIHLARDLAQLMSECATDERVARLLPHAVLVPVPLHIRREQWRHFNQSKEIALFLGRLWQLPVCDLLKRSIYTSPQAHLSRKSRLKNLDNAFSIKKLPKKSKLIRLLEKRPNCILIDDVLTTGTTAHQCALQLKALSEVEKVIVLTAMRG